jgi:hypothetical protein
MRIIDCEKRREEEVSESERESAEGGGELRRAKMERKGKRGKAR